MAKYPAAFINVIADDGTKAEAIEQLQILWDEHVNLRIALSRLGFKPEQVQKMCEEGTLGKVF